MRNSNHIIMIAIIITLIILNLCTQKCYAMSKENPAGSCENCYFNINRLQYRKLIGKSLDVGHVITQTSYFSFPNKLFFLDHIEYYFDGNIYFEFFTGIPLMPSHELGKSLGWVGRINAETDKKPTYSLGVIWYISDTPGFNVVFRKRKLKTLVEVFFVKNNDNNGSVDIFHHYTFPIMNKLYVRGYNRLLFNVPNEGTIIYAVLDIIIPYTKTIELYWRNSYQNIDNYQSRKNGITFYIGLRYNFSMK